MLSNIGLLIMDFENFCADSATIWSIVGWILTIFKIIIPILLIIFGSIDFGKAVVAQKDEEIKKASKQLAFRATGALVVYILPAVVVMLINWIMEVSNTEMDYETCTNCVVHPSRCGKDS